jgi:hypothetical protein
MFARQRLNACLVSGRNVSILSSVRSSLAYRGWVVAVFRIELQAVIPAIVESIRDPKPSVRQAAINCLSCLGAEGDHPVVRPKLCSILKLGCSRVPDRNPGSDSRHRGIHEGSRSLCSSGCDWLPVQSRGPRCAPLSLSSPALWLTEAGS